MQGFQPSWHIQEKDADCKDHGKHVSDIVFFQKQLRDKQEVMDKKQYKERQYQHSCFKNDVFQFSGLQRMIVV